MPAQLVRAPERVLEHSWGGVSNIVKQRRESCYFIGSFKCYILMYKNPVCRQTCEKLFLSKRNIMNWNYKSGFDTELDKPINVIVFSMWYIQCLWRDCWMWSEVSTAVRSLILVYQNTRRQISDNRQLHALKYMYCWKLINFLHHSAMDIWSDCNVVSTG